MIALAINTDGSLSNRKVARYGTPLIISALAPDDQAIKVGGHWAADRKIKLLRGYNETGSSGNL